MVTEEQDFLVDVEKIIKDKAGDKAKYIPGFLISWLKKTLHQDEVNSFLGGRAKGKLGVDFLDECVDYLEMDIEVKGLEDSWRQFPHESLSTAPLIAFRALLQSLNIHGRCEYPPICIYQDPCPKASAHVRR